MSNPFKLSIRLQQHSPLIHFQHHQHGATLRATELKPKLDKFIIGKAFKDFQVLKKYLVEHDEKKYEKLNGQERKKYEKEIHNALAYKIKIHSPEVKGREIRHSLFFGNIGKKENKFQSVSVPSNEDIQLEILCFCEGLIEAIKSCLPGFFASTNFGTRQDKGFGSFYISERDQYLYRDILAILPKGTSFLEIRSTDDSTVFSTIDYYYKRLKSGINPNNNAKCLPGYQKAYLYKYLESKHDYTWEKRWIKETFFGLTPDSRNKKFARALLGLPGSFSFLATDEPCNPVKDKVRIEDAYEITVANKNIQRIQSPIFFKIIKDFNRKESKIFVLVNEEFEKKISQLITQSNTSSIEFDFFPKFRLKYHTYMDKNGRKKYKSELIPWKKGLSQKEQKEFENKYKQKIEKAKKLEEEGDKGVKGQITRFDEFQYKNFYSRRIELPSGVIDYQDLINAYNEQELKGTIDDEYKMRKIKANIKTI
jgi:hypothetical protein